jgi:hypothetical protein
MKKNIPLLIWFAVLIYSAYNVGFSKGQTAAMKILQKEKTAEEKAADRHEAIETAFSFYMAGCMDSMDEMKMRMKASGDPGPYCKAKTAARQKAYEDSP